jgi:DHA2 family multidrug resistance protein
MKHFDSRYLIAFGMLLFGGSCFLITSLNQDFSGPQLYFPLLLRAMGQPFIIVPLSAMATSGMAKGRETGAASALFNMLRNLGGSFAIAGLSTLLSVRERLHSFRIGESVSLYSSATQSALQNLTNLFLSRGADPTSAQARAIGVVGGSIRQQAYFLSFGDCFLALGMVLLASASVLILMKKAQATDGGGGH